jgi:hypothetical protein
VHPTLTIQELQTIKLKHHNNNYINQIKFIKLLCDDCHKQAILIYDSHDDSNWCTPYRGKPDEHATHFRCPVRVWPSTICLSHGPRITTFHVTVNRFEQIHWPQEGLLTQSTARQPWVRTQLLSQQPMKHLAKVKLLLTIGYYACWTHIPACDRYVQYLLARANPSVLNWHRWRLQP